MSARRRVVRRTGSCRPLLPRGGHGLHASGLAAREIPAFGRIVPEIVELPRPALDPHELPIAVADRAVAFVLDADRARRDGRAGEGRHQAHAFARHDRLTVALAGISGSRCLADRGHEIGDETR